MESCAPQGGAPATGSLQHLAHVRDACARVGRGSRVSRQDVRTHDAHDARHPVLRLRPEPGPALGKTGRVIVDLPGPKLRMEIRQFEEGVVHLPRRKGRWGRSLAPTRVVLVAAHTGGAPRSPYPRTGCHTPSTATCFARQTRASGRRGRQRIGELRAETSDACDPPSQMLSTMGPTRSSGPHEAICAEHLVPRPVDRRRPQERLARVEKGRLESP